MLDETQYTVIETPLYEKMNRIISVARYTLNRLKKMDSISPKVYEELSREFKRYER